MSLGNNIISKEPNNLFSIFRHFRAKRPAKRLLSLCVLVVAVACLHFQQDVYGKQRKDVTGVVKMLPDTTSMTPTSSLVVNEYQLKAIYIYKIMVFTIWPNEKANDFITLGIIGDDQFKNYFSPLINKKIKGRNKKFNVIRLGSDYSKFDYSKCDAVFISSSEHKKHNQIIKSINNLPVLVIGDHEGFINANGMVSLVTRNNSINININNPPINKAKLKLNSIIYKQAKIVID